MMSRFIQSSVIENATNVANIDVYSEKNLIPIKEIILPFATREAIRTCRTNLTDKDIFAFRSDCRKVLQCFCFKLIERSPLKYNLVKAISFLDPRIAKNSAVRKIRFTQTLEIFLKKRWIDGALADKINHQFTTVCNQDMVIEIIKNFNKLNDRLDHLWLKQIILSHDENKDLIGFLQMIFVLSHGNASLERGFSINKECLIDNMQKESLIAQRLIYDTVIAKGGIDNINIDKHLILSCRNAHSRYKEALEKRKLERENRKTVESEAKLKILKLKELETKKKDILEKARIQTTEIDECLQSLHFQGHR